jgi:transcription initiation factor IIE alpha subunit
MDLICANCQTIFVLQMRTQLMGSNSKAMYVFVYYQLCPNCKEPIVGVKEQKDLDALNIDIKDLILLIKPNRSK